MLKTSFVLLFIGIVALSGCDRLLMNEKRQEIGKINLRGLLDTLHIQVYHANPLLIKKAQLNDHLDSAVLHLDSAQWQKEFENFSDLKLRPGRVLSQYNESVVEVGAGLEYFYRSKNHEKEALDSFLIGTTAKGHIYYLHAYIHSENYFNSTSRELRIDFSEQKNGTFLPEHYFVDGWQKIRTKDTVRFEIEALLKY